MNNEEMMDRPVSEIDGVRSRLASAVIDQEWLMDELRKRLAEVSGDTTSNISEPMEKRPEVHSPMGRELNEISDRIETNNRAIRKMLADCQL